MKTLVWVSCILRAIEAAGTDFKLLPAMLGNNSVSLLVASWSQSTPSIFGRNFAAHSHGVFKRQEEECVPASYVPCPNQPGDCCPPGDTCFATICCNEGYEPCGGENCYNPETSKCCSDGSYCDLDEDCIGGGYCCPSGQQRCETSQRCYDPATQICCSDGTNCPKGYDCMGDLICCPAGHKRCGSGNRCYDPETEVCCDEGDTVFACESGQTCCTEGGATTCYDAATEQCCPGGSCDKDYTCCGNECCGSGSNCGSDGYCTGAPSATATQQSPTATGASMQTTTETITFKYDPNRTVKGKDGKIYDAQNRAVMDNMCAGLEKLLGSGAQEIELERASDAIRRANRKTMCPKGYCASALKDYLSKYYPDGLDAAAQQAITLAEDLSCDEFPFAISTAGGDLSTGTRICLPSAENSWQGGTMSNYFKNGRIKVGDKFKVVIDGYDCSKRAPIKIKRDTQSTHADQLLFHGFDTANPNDNLLAMPLGDLDAGTYKVNFAVQTGTLDFSVLTYDGNTIDATNNNGVITFTLDQDEYAVSVVGVTQDQNVNATYSSAQVSTSGSTSDAVSNYVWSWSRSYAITLAMLLQWLL